MGSTPWLTPSLPGSEEPVVSHLSVQKPFSAQSYFFSTDDEGRFETWVIPASDYVLSVVPSTDGAVFKTMNLTVEPGTNVQQDVYLEYGQTLWGRVTNNGGQGISSVGIYAEDPHGNRSATTYTNDAGYYSIRVLAGNYTLHSIGRSEQSGRDPVLSSAITVNPGEDLRSDFIIPT